MRWYARTGSWMGPPQGKRAPRVGPISIVIHRRPSGFGYTVFGHQCPRPRPPVELLPKLWSITCPELRTNETRVPAQDPCEKTHAVPRTRPSKNERSTLPARVDRLVSVSVRVEGLGGPSLPHSRSPSLRASTPLSTSSGQPPPEIALLFFMSDTQSL